MSSSGGSAIKLIHRIFFSVILVVSIVAMSIAAALVAYYEKSGYPNNEYRDRIRICLAAGIWSTLVSAYLLIGFLFAALSQAFNIFVHLILLLIAFILYIIGAASLLALTNNTDCGAVEWDHCTLTKALNGVAWVDVIIIFIVLILIFALGVKSRSGAGMRRSTLLDA